MGPKVIPLAAPVWVTASAPPMAAKKAEAQNTMRRAVVVDRPCVDSIVGDSARAPSRRPKRPRWKARTPTTQTTTVTSITK